MRKSSQTQQGLNQGSRDIRESASGNMGIRAQSRQPTCLGEPTPWHHRLSLNSGRGALYMPLSWPPPMAPAVLPGDHLLLWSVERLRPQQHPRQEACSTLVPLTADGDNDLRAGVKSKFLLPTPSRGGTSWPNEQTGRRPQQSWPHNAMLLCRMGAPRASRPGAGHRLRRTAGCVCVFYREWQTRKGWDICTAHRDRDKLGNGQGTCNSFFAAQPWGEQAQ